MGLPILGYTPFLQPRPFEAFRRLAKQYGDVMWVKLGTEDLLVLTSYEAIREALVRQGDVFSARPHSAYRDRFTHDCDVVFTEDQMWQDHRGFALKTLRDFGFAKSISVDIIHAEIEHMRRGIEEICGQPKNTVNMFMEHTSNILFNLNFGSRAGAEDPECRQLFQQMNDLSSLDGSFLASLPFYLPTLVKVPEVVDWFNSFIGREKIYNDIYAFIRLQIREHEARIDECGVEKQPENFVDALVLHRRKLDRVGSAHTFTEWSLIRDIFELFFAGTDTSAMSLIWSCIFLSLNPDVQKRVQEEIRSVLGPDRLPTMNDRKELPFTCATIDEVARLGTIVPISVPHRTTRDTKLFGFDIPADMKVYPHIYAVHRDAKLWKSPEKFDPANFLDDEDNYKSSEYLIPFSIGKRACLGEALARMEFFLFFVSIMQRFRVSIKQPINMDELMWGAGGTVHRPGNHEIIFEKLE